MPRPKTTGLTLLRLHREDKKAAGVNSKPASGVADIFGRINEESYSGFSR
jgi:hypothetical protein